MADTDLLAAPAASNGELAWRTDRKGREYIPRRGDTGSGIVYRQGEESIEEAWARDRDAAEKKRKTPKSGKRQRKPPAPTQVDLKTLEHQLRQALETPVMVCAMQGDEWGVQHFQNQAPRLARNMVACAEANPWFREKLVAAMTGGDVLPQVMMFASLGAAAFAYVVPPIVYYLNPGFLPPRAVGMVREKFAIPEPTVVAMGDQDQVDFAAAEASAYAAPSLADEA